MSSEKEIYMKIADRLKELGHRYYEEKGNNVATAVFWELEAIYRNLAKEKVKC